MSRDRVRVPVFTVNIPYATTTVTDAAYVEVVHSLAYDIKELDIFDSGGSIMKLGYGAAAAEQDLMIVPNGGLGQRPCLLNKGHRLAVKCYTGQAQPTTGNLIITGYV